MKSAIAASDKNRPGRNGVLLQKEGRTTSIMIQGGSRSLSVQKRSENVETKRGPFIDVSAPARMMLICPPRRLTLVFKAEIPTRSINK
jgi:hypothetical protein